MDVPVVRVQCDVFAAEKRTQHAPLWLRQRIQADMTVPSGQHVAGTGAGAHARIALHDDVAIFETQARDLRAAEHGLLDAGLHVIAATVAGSTENGQQGCRGRVGAAERFGDGAPHLQGFALGNPAQMRPSSQGAGDEMGALEPGVGSVVAETGHRGEHRGWVPGVDLGVANS